MNTPTAYAIILAAGRGSRMGGLTIDRPKCLLELRGKPLLQWQLEALRAAGVANVLVVRGYRGEMLTPQALPWAGSFDDTENPRWAHSNMLRTLLCASHQVNEMFAKGVRHILVAYADIVYRPDHIRALTTSATDIAITFDTLWEPLWRLRFGDPLLDAETFRQKDGVLREIGGKPQRIEDIQGQYMGLLKFTENGWRTLEKICASLGKRLDSTDITSFLRELLDRDIPIGAIAVHGGWCEADSATDLHNYEAMLVRGNWLHDWR